MRKPALGESYLAVKKREMRKLLFWVAASATLLSCGGRGHSGERLLADELFLAHDSALAQADAFSDTVEIKYARGLRVSYEADGIHIQVSNPDPSLSSRQTEEFVLTSPLRRFICTTALQLGNFEALELEDCVVGINSLKNLFSPAVKRQLGSGQTRKIGREGNFDLETVLVLKPDLILVSASKHGGFEVLRQCGVPLLTHHGYKETDPLGQAEWVKLVGLLTGQTRRANAVFADIEKKYLTLRDEVAACSRQSGAKQPTVASGRQIRDGWYVVGGRSYMARLFSDAGADYVMGDNEDSGGRTLDFEAAYARAVHADFWQTDGAFDGEFTLQTLAAEDGRYATLAAFRAGRVIFCNFSQTPYRELAAVQPHFLLADFVKAFHPELLPHYEPKYYKLIK